MHTEIRCMVKIILQSCNMVMVCKRSKCMLFQYLKWKTSLWAVTAYAALLIVTEYRLIYKYIFVLQYTKSDAAALQHQHCHVLVLYICFIFVNLISSSAISSRFMTGFFLIFDSMLFCRTLNLSIVHRSYFSSYRVVILFLSYRN